MSSRYLIGIDLGTTNCAISYLDTKGKPLVSRVLAIPQLESPGVTRAFDTLPSFFYFNPSAEPSVGVYAREQSAVQPGRVVSSAKSWMCQSGVAAEEKLLPWASTEVSSAEKVSPIEVSARYLTFLRETWDQQFPEPSDRFDEQEITITVPASFDESAQYATLEAAKRAGYPSQVRLLEEPQAAFYSYLEKKKKVGQKKGESPLKALDRPQSVLVCDIGGGTTDFSLFEIQPAVAHQRVPRIHRVAVSDHLLLGGDNIDLAIAHRLEAKLARKLSPRQWSYLVSRARGLKERMLSGKLESPEEIFHVSIPGSGSSLIETALSVSLTRGEVSQLVLEGFFPLCASRDRPHQSQPGLREWGLAFATDSAVTRHLSGFLNGREVNAVLFNGGTLSPKFLQSRLVEQIARWQNGRLPDWLANEEMDLSVARGAAFYGLTLRRKTGHIQGGYPHAVYLELSKENRFEPASLVCLIPRGFEPGDKRKIDALRFQLLVDRPVGFQLHYSNSQSSQAGDVVRRDESFRSLPILQTKLTLKPGRVKPANGLLDISLEITLSETGLLQVFCVEGKGERWQLDFNLRKQAEVSREVAHEATPERLRRALDQIEIFYGKKMTGELKQTPKTLKTDLEIILGEKREDWDLALLRGLWVGLAPGITRRVRSEAHEIAWLYLAGLCLRPGYGSELDRWRLSELWRCFAVGPSHPKNASVLTQWWILWRRVSGGLDAEQQQQLVNRLMPMITAKPEPHPEIILLAGSLERVGLPTKISLGTRLLTRLFERKTVAIEQHLWALGRIANRVPLYAGVHATVDPVTVEGWVKKALTLDLPKRAHINLTLFLSQACSLTGDRHRDIGTDLRADVMTHMLRLGASEEQLQRLQKVVCEDLGSQARLFGESLPAGLRIAG